MISFPLQSLPLITRTLTTLLLGWVVSLHAANFILPPAPQISAKSYALVDFNTGKVLLEKNSTLPMEPASITKVMTTYVALQEASHGALGEEVAISNKAYKAVGSRTFLELNSQVPLREVLLGLIIQSGNDSAIALAEHVYGDEKSFVAQMNEYARRLGMNTTNFVNSTGLPDPEHYSSAEDMVKLGAALIREFPQYYKFFAEKSMTYNGIKQFNRNRLLWRDPTVDGIKTGHTKSAGYCLLASAKRGKIRFISVVLGSSSDKQRNIQSQRLLNYGFKYFTNVTIEQANVPLKKKRVWFGNVDELKLGFDTDWLITVPKRIANKIDVKYRLQDARLDAPINVGDEVGKVEIFYKKELLAERSMLALNRVERGGFFKMILDYISYFFFWIGSFFENIR